MATAQAKTLYARTHKKVFVVDKVGRARWHDVFDNNPKISRFPSLSCVRLINGPNARPYIASRSATHWTWQRWDIQPGEIFLTQRERQFARPYAGAVLIEPGTKVPDSNKAWIWNRWQELVDRGGNFVQVGPSGVRQLRGVRRVITPSFRLACAVLEQSRAFVGTEGGMHHAAAALNKPAVVLFSEFIGPEITGYKQHRNIRHAGGMCGALYVCDGCRKSMEAIEVDEVAENLKEILR